MKMGKRKVLRKENVSKIDRPLYHLWPEKVIEELLAYLEFARAEGFQRAEIDESCAEHLSRWNHNGPYTSDQVKRKLQRLWQEYGPDDDLSRDPERIYVKGSNSLSWFYNEEQKKEVAKRTSEIRREQALASTYAPRQLRSASKQVIESPSPSDRLKSTRGSTIGFSQGSLALPQSTFIPDSLGEVSRLVAMRLQRKS
jgi:hypothetical protein